MYCVEIWQCSSFVVMFYVRQRSVGENLNGRWNLSIPGNIYHKNRKSQTFCLVSEWKGVGLSQNNQGQDWVPEIAEHLKI